MGKERAQAVPAPAVTILEGTRCLLWKTSTTLWDTTHSIQSQGPKGTCILQSGICKRTSRHEAAQLRCWTALAKVHFCWELI